LARRKTVFVGVMLSAAVLFGWTEMFGDSESEDSGTQHQQPNWTYSEPEPDEVTNDSDYRSGAKDLESRLFGSQQNAPESQVVEDVAEEHGVSESELKKAYNCELYDGEPAGCDQYGY